MIINNYYDFVLVVDTVQRDNSGSQQFSVRVLESPAGESKAPEFISPIPPSLQRKIRQLENRQLEEKDIVNLGEQLADFLLPDPVRQLFLNSLSRLQPNEGLRLRLFLDPSLVSIPWEYLYIHELTEAKNSMGFCGLNPKISIVRHELLPVGVKLDMTPKKRRLLVALASPQDEELLRLDKERENIDRALKEIPGIEPVYVQDATAQKLLDELIAGADIFHFAGHGKFKQSISDDSGGYILLLGEDGKSAPMPAESLAVNLQSRGVQLVFLGACETGRRDEQNAWSGVVTNLMAAGIPAAIAMQYKIWDESAIAFSGTFYKALAAGLPLEQAVSLGRIAVFNQCDALKDKEQRQKYWRDWGVPVLYCRVRGNFVLPTIMTESHRKTLLDELQGASDVVQNQSGGVNNSGTMNHSPVIQGNENVLQSGGKYNTYIRTANGPVATGDNPHIVNPTFGNVTNSPIGVAGGDVTLGDVIYGAEKTSENDVRSLFNSILDRVRRLPADPDVGNDEILQDVERIRKEVLRGREANLKKIERWLKSLEVAPEIQEAVVITLEGHHPDITELIRQLATSVRR
ncbi:MULTISPECIES: CHAT domain-containing protein [unclassified Microcoleus]|uniref:CHAT domain-containing protein n=1 Tax=unclassified Microcoleus TaxID=2642155 RepID=UPI001DCC1229|nr:MULTISPECIES: CHAT domain-containing protein [unclassified Microcoleus]MCC3506619.1 CHAT domain-containing protein [Microcoleus sp. PH2017_19_SFW_U_A]MCC3473864.1 CHAT domain-containing protein [Microcoleus sp. PH2017_13_LAR_U_A]MCC3486301.1 CHAT domain-containing protein [Microcoleus sp. PH2017_14_LAR_D_A]MCC3500476.1 CHAT domain-containing protein [Microcoleus sp. PH2017_15_JOR_U_A]MCC3525981.1 CHAT domain-containing protein [Microcoleus sp. PH2017_20_SFW_D_A]